MPLCAYKNIRQRNDNTIVENVFIEEYMPSAPGECIKVYLYGLMQCQTGTGESTPEGFARKLGLEVEDVLAAFNYWQHRGLVSVITRPVYTVLYESARSALPIEPDIYVDSKYNETINALFSPKVLSSMDYVKIYDWTDIFGIRREAVPLLIEYGRSKMRNAEHASANALISYIDKIARQWADTGIKTAEDAKNWIDKQSQHTSGLTALMRKMGMHRAPTASERKLYNSWIEAGFTQKAIEAAAEKMTGAYSPNFKYLNEIMHSLTREGAYTEKEIRADNTEELCREALCALGVKNPSPSSSQLNAYKTWKEEGFDHEHILLACEICKSRNQLKIRDVSSTLYRWHGENLKSIRSIKRYEEARRIAESDMAEAYRRMGLARKVQDADIDLYKKWTQGGMPPEVIYVAAEHSLGLSFKAFVELVEKWSDAGIKTVKEARKHSETAAKNPALNYDQRKAQEFTGLFEEL